MCSSLSCRQETARANRVLVDVQDVGSRSYFWILSVLLVVSIHENGWHILPRSVLPIKTSTERHILVDFWYAHRDMENQKKPFLAHLEANERG
jgi:hypothetical protein